MLHCCCVLVVVDKDKVCVRASCWFLVQFKFQANKMMMIGLDHIQISTVLHTGGRLIDGITHRINQ